MHLIGRGVCKSLTMYQVNISWLIQQGFGQHWTTTRQLTFTRQCTVTHKLVSAMLPSAAVVQKRAAVDDRSCDMVLHNALKDVTYCP